MAISDAPASRVLVLTPIGRDAEASARLIEQAGLTAEVARHLATLVERLCDEVAAVLLAEEALYGQSLDALAAWVQDQPPWSDQPFVILTNQNQGPKFGAFRQRLVTILRNVSFLERPLQALTLQAAMRAAVRARQRQYQARAYLEHQRDASLQLERLVSERTAELERANRLLRDEMQRGELAQAALFQAQKIETMGQLVGGVAHDFNNLLMAVIGNLDLLKKWVGAEPRQMRLVDGALEGARRGATLTQRLLAFARRQELQPQATDIVQLVEDLRNLIERSVGPLVDVRIEADAALPAVTVDPNQLEMALLNLSVNARDAMPLGGTLLIRLTTADLSGAEFALPAGRYLHLAVSDTGEGMAPETLSKAVEPFFSTKGVGKGTGLGLSMVDGLANQSGGAFRLESQVGQGTTANLWLPATTSIAQPPQPTPLAAPSTAAASVLLVDDDALIAASTVALLEDLGHTVIEANSAREALDHIEAGLRPDILITDHAMPGMTGMELAVQLRSKLPDLPILLATGFAELEGSQMIDLPRLPKPYTQNQLAAEISRLLGARSKAST